MRTALLVALLALAPAVASAQDSEEPFDRAAALLEEDTWVLDDGVEVEEVPWEAVDPAVTYGPPGIVHPGVQLRVGGLIGGAMEVPDGPIFDLSAFLDIRYSQRKPLRMRIAIALSAQQYWEDYGSGGTHVVSSPFAARLRLYPISFDAGRYVVIRAAGEIGFQWVPFPEQSTGEIQPFYGASGELAVLLLDGALELGVFGGFQFTAYALTTRWGREQHQSFDGAIGGTVSYVF